MAALEQLTVKSWDPRVMYWKDMENELIVSSGSDQTTGKGSRGSSKSKLQLRRTDHKVVPVKKYCDFNGAWGKQDTFLIR